MLWKGKPLSLASKLLSVVWLLTAVVLKALGIFRGITVWEIVLVSGVLIIAFAPVDLSLIIENIIKGKVPIPGPDREPVGFNTSSTGNTQGR